jgi:hypothetical protein
VFSGGIGRKSKQVYESEGNRLEAAGRVSEGSVESLSESVRLDANHLKKDFQAHGMSLPGRYAKGAVAASFTDLFGYNICVANASTNLVLRHREDIHIRR